MSIAEQIASFTSVAPIPVSWSFGPKHGYGYELVRERVVRETEYRTQYRSSDSGYGFAGGFLLGSMF